MKKTISIIIAIFLIGSVIAIGIKVSDKTISLTPSSKSWYNLKHINPTYEDYEQGDEYWRCLISNTDFNLPCSSKYKGIKDEAKLDKWMEETLEQITQVYLMRESRPKKEVVQEGTIIFK